MENSLAKKLWKPFLTVLLAVITVEIVLILSATSVTFNNPSTTVQIETNTMNAPENVFRMLSTKADDDFVYDNPLDTYSPSQFVIYGHKLTGMQFAFTMEYGQRLLYAPIITFGLGFLAIFLTHFGLLCRCCFDCCRCLPNSDSVHYDRDRFCLVVFYFVLCILVLVIDQLVFLGNQSIDTGVKLIKGDIKTLNNLLTLIDDDSGQLSDYAGVLSSEYTDVTNTCASFPTNLGSTITDFQKSMSDLTNALGDVTDNIDMIDGYIDKYAIFYRNIGLYVIWGLAIGAIGFFGLSKFCESICFTKWSIFFGTVTYILFLVLGVPWLFLTEVGGDLCMQPTENLLRAVPIDTIRNISMYYATCSGESLLASYVTSGFASVSDLNQTVYYFMNPNNHPNCAGNTHLQAMATTLDGTFVSIDDINTNLACGPFNFLWFDILNKGFCQDLYQGIFYIWGSQLVTSFLLFVLIVISAFLYQYYDLGKIGPADDADEGDEEEDNKMVKHAREKDEVDL